MNKPSIIDLIETYSQIKPGGLTTSWDAEEFWQKAKKTGKEKSNQGHLVGVYEFAEDWPSWERHLDGE